jgi:hypothetical protein
LVWKREEMEKIIGDWNTQVRMTGDEAKEVCKLGQGSLCCAFLVIGGAGFECIRMDYPGNVTIFNRLEAGTMNAKGRGGWKRCPWAKILKGEKW